MVVRIEGVNIPDNKRVEIALRYLKGIGKTRARAIVEAAQININKRVRDLTEDEINKIRSKIGAENYNLEADLQRLVFSNIKRLKETGSWRGLRHGRHLPVRGQRTRTNSRTVRGNIRKTATSGKKPAAQKT